MIHSMTGFAVVSGEIGDRTVTVQMKSVNNRALDVYVKFPGVAVDFEQGLRDAVKARIQRGRVDVWIEIRSAEAEVPALNLEAARLHLAQLTALQREMGAAEPVALRDLLGLPGLFTAGEDDFLSDPEFQAAVKKLLGQALDRFVAMRRQEGENLEQVVRERLDAMAAAIDGIAGRQDDVRLEYFEKWRKRLKEILGESVPLDEGRLLQEAAYLAEKADIAEEIDRFRSHLQQFREALAGGSPVGKKLDFILQEMNREVNTILSKTERLDLSRTGIELKADVEKIREQVQNFE
jgi:uncharacterized protein (TIGR00255 family)